MTKVTEIWKEIEGFNGLYLISESGKVWSNWKDRELKKSVRKYNYCAVWLTNEDKTGKWHYIHRLVASTFVENPHNKPCVNHKDRNPLNNHFSNLEWVTHRENIQHSFDNGRPILKGEQVSHSVLTKKEVKAIRKRFDNGETWHEIAKDYNVTYQCIYAIVKRITWKHV